VVVRAAGEADLYRLVRLMAHVQAVHAAARPDLFRRRLDRRGATAMFAAALAADCERLLLAEAAGEAVGYAWLALVDRPGDPATRARRFAYLNHVGVAPGARGRGVGRALVEAGRGWASAAGLREIGVDYWAFNTSAAGFFARLGFTPERHIAFASL
jgi:GNAT superfamily N-acetyltransferase